MNRPQNTSSRQDTPRPTKSPQSRQNSRCPNCGQRFRLWQRITITDRGEITCKACNSVYRVSLQINSAVTGGLGGGLGGASIIYGYWAGEKYLSEPLLGLATGVLVAVIVILVVYQYTWKKAVLSPA